MSELQEGWDLVPLSELGVSVRDSISPQSGVTYELWSVPSFAEGCPEIAAGQDIGSAKLSVEVDDVLVCKINPRINRVWRVTERESGLPRIASPEWLVLRARDKSAVSSMYLQYFLSSPRFREWIVSEVTGVTGSHTRAKADGILKQEVPLPPLDEQLRIVGILDDQVSRLNSADSALARTRIQLIALERSSIESAVRLATKDPGSTSLTIADLGRVTSGATPLKSNRGYYTGGNIPWITSGELGQGLVTLPKQYVTESALSETSIKMLPAGSLLVAMYGEGKTRGTVAELGVPATTNQACAAITFLDRYASLKDWVHLVLRVNYFALRTLAAGGVQPNLNLGLIKAIQVPIPQETLREQLLFKTSTITQFRMRMEDELARAEAKSHGLRRSLLQAAFSGELTRKAPEHSDV